jgi:hypothetical protein
VVLRNIVVGPSNLISDQWTKRQSMQQREGGKICNQCRRFESLETSNELSVDIEKIFLVRGLRNMFVQYCIPVVRRETVGKAGPNESVRRRLCNVSYLKITIMAARYGK